MLTDFADRRTPRAVRKALAEFGGYNRFGGANWRVIVAEDHMSLRGGVHKTMPSGNVKSIDLERLPNGTYKMHHSEVKPDKVETGWKMVPEWGLAGWVLEKWFAPETVNRAVWEDARSEDGTPMMGPYPDKGYYFMLAGPWEQMPTLADLRLAIAMHIRTEEERPQEYQQLLLQRIHAETEAKERAYKEALDNLGHFYESEVEPVMRGTSLGAGRIRNDLAAQVGDFAQHGVV